MKLRHVAAIVAFVAVVLVGSALALLYFNQQRLIAAVLDNVQKQTGIDIIPESAHLEIRTHLVVMLERPRVMKGNHEIVSLTRIRALVNYRAIVFKHGLPLRRLTLQGPTLKAPLPASAVSGGGTMPQPSRDLIRRTLAGLGDLGRLGRRLDIIDLTLNDETGKPLLRNAHLTAYHRRLAPKLWMISFEGDCAIPVFAGTHAAGDFQLGSGGELPTDIVMKGKIWYWKLPLDHLSIGNLDIAGGSHGQLSLSLAQDATVDGEAEIGLRDLTIASPDLSVPLELGDYTLQARFTTSSQKVTISQAQIIHGGEPLIAAQAYIERPYEQNPQVGIDLGGVRITWENALSRIRALKRVPQQVELLVQHLTSGQLQVEKASMESPLDALLKLTPETFLKNLSITATLKGLSFKPPAESDLPDVSSASVQIQFAKQVLSALQGSATVGHSQITAMTARLDLSQSLDDVPYQVGFKADADMAELKPATLKLLEVFNVRERERLETLQGIAHVEADASGELRKQTPTRPESYFVRVEPHNLTARFHGAPGPLSIASGTIIVEPDIIRLKKVSARATGGTADFDGDLRIAASGVRTRGITVDVHQMPMERWLPIAVDPDDFSSTGDLGGRVIVSSDGDGGFLLNGKLTLMQGKVQFGFMRSPILARPAIITLHDHSVHVAMPGAELEKSPIDFNITVPDIRNPQIRLDAVVQKLDIEVLKFVRLPWEPPTPSHPPRVPITGHIDAREANLETFGMTNTRTDFSYDRGDWRVYNLTAQAFEGDLNMEILGRRKDDWIHILSRVNGINLGSIFLLSSKFQHEPISGHFDMNADVWGDTDGDFFATLAGATSLKIYDGNLHKFTLLSRLLGLIDLRSWITANVPDPRVSGVQFRTMTADFIGDQGVFYTDNLKLDGPVMDIVANGNINLDQSTLEMKIGMIPFNTVNWLLSNVPVVGQNVAGGTQSIIAAYFNVRGPISDPTVTPAPITSVAELLKKTLGLPVNLIRPDTIK